MLAASVFGQGRRQRWRPYRRRSRSHREARAVLLESPASVTLAVRDGALVARFGAESLDPGGESPARGSR